MSKLQVIAEKNLLSNEIHFKCLEVGLSYEVARVIPGLLMSEPYDPGVVAHPPTFKLDMPEAQELLDQLYACGLRPTKEADHTGEIKAINRHLEDMRSITFEMLSLKK